jgi:hypothetical protein
MTSHSNGRTEIGCRYLKKERTNVRLFDPDVDIAIRDYKTLK